MTPHLPPRLLALTPGRTVAEPRALDELQRRVNDAVRAGLGGVLLREPELDDRYLFQTAVALRARWPQLWIGLHDRPHLVEAAGAQAAHLGWASLSAREVRPWLPAEASVGLSTHAEDSTESWTEADYLFHGPVFDTPKDPPAAPLGSAGFARAVERSSAPIWALGGITPDNAAEVLGAGAAGIAVLGGLLAADDPAGRTSAYLELLNRQPG